MKNDGLSRLEARTSDANLTVCASFLIRTNNYLYLTSFIIPRKIRAK